VEQCLVSFAWPERACTYRAHCSWGDVITRGARSVRIRSCRNRVCTDRIGYPEIVELSLSLSLSPSFSSCVFFYLIRAGQHETNTYTYAYRVPPARIDSCRRHHRSDFVRRQLSCRGHCTVWLLPILWRVAFSGSPYDLVDILSRRDFFFDRESESDFDRLADFPV